MTKAVLTRPQENEYAPYYHKYISPILDQDLFTLLEQQAKESIQLLKEISEEKAGFRYAPEKWSIKEVVGHVNDTERIFAYRALRIARNDSTPLPGYDENHFVANSNFDQRSLESLISEFEIVRNATLSLFRNLANESWERMGAANQSPVSVRALAYIIAGHERHHIGVLKERYLSV